MNVVLFILAERVGAYPTFTLMIALYCGTMNISKKEGAEMKVPVKGVVVFSLGAIIGFLANGLLSIDEQLDEDAEERSYQEGSLDSQVVYLSKHGKAFHRIDCPSCAKSGTELYPLTLFSALQRGKKPCTNCKPLDISH